MKIELPGSTRYYNIEDGEGNEYLLIEMYDANSDSTEYEITMDGETLNDAITRVKIIASLINHQMNTQL